jgi:hypothetical protein
MSPRSCYSELDEAQLAPRVPSRRPPEATSAGPPPRPCRSCASSSTLSDTPSRRLRDRLLLGLPAATARAGGGDPPLDRHRAPRMTPTPAHLGALLRVSPLCLGTLDFGPHSRRSRHTHGPRRHRPGRRALRRHRQRPRRQVRRGWRSTFVGNWLAQGGRTPRPHGAGDQAARGDRSGTERVRAFRTGDPPAVRRLAAPAEDRRHRPSPDASHRGRARRTAAPTTPQLSRPQPRLDRHAGGAAAAGRRRDDRAAPAEPARDIGRRPERWLVRRYDQPPGLRRPGVADKQQPQPLRAAAETPRCAPRRAPAAASAPRTRRQGSRTAMPATRASGPGSRTRARPAR